MARGTTRPSRLLGGSDHEQKIAGLDRGRRADDETLDDAVHGAVMAASIFIASMDATG
jgi:hypothetical protein